MGDNFTRKERRFEGVHMIEPPASITYWSVVSRDSSHITFMLAVLNCIDVHATDIGNAYLNAPIPVK